MRLVVGKAALRGLLRWAQWSLFAAGALLLGYSAFVLLDAWRFEQTAQERVEAGGRAALKAELPQERIAGLIGKLEIRRLEISVAVVEGTTNKTLRRAAGHISGTAMPGQFGNTAISAHRDTFFRPLRNVRRDDVIEVQTFDGEYRYRVVTTEIVDPLRVDVLDSKGIEELTLVTCYPFYFIGEAPKRFIVKAVRVGKS